MDAFVRHPHAVGETYAGHLRTAAGFGLTMIATGLACLVHAIFPFWFERTASACVQRLAAHMAQRRTSSPVPPISASTSAT